MTKPPANSAASNRLFRIVATSLQLPGLRVAWLTTVLLPLPAMVFWRSQDGRCVALWCFCAACFSLAAYSFYRPPVSEPTALSWLDKVSTLAVFLSLAWISFSLLWIALVDPHDFVALFVGFEILIPSLCVVPYLTLLTRKPFAAVVFTAFLLGCMKGVAGVVVNLFYGWGNGHHEIPWTSPNLMLSMFWVASVVLCLWCYLLGARKFQSEYEQVARQLLERTWPTTSPSNSASAT